MFGSLATLADALGPAGPQDRDRDRVILALIDLPLAVVRRHLRAGSPLPPYAEDLAEESAATLLARTYT